MKYSQQLVWDSIYTIIPVFKIANESGAIINLPIALSSAGVECFLKAEESNYKTDKNFIAATSIIREALTELNNAGWMAFGTEEEFWK